MGYQEEMIRQLQEENLRLVKSMDGMLKEKSMYLRERDELLRDRERLMGMWEKESGEEHSRSLKGRVYDYRDIEKRLSIENRELKLKIQKLKEDMARLDSYILKTPKTSSKGV